jgi:hypothetical protein
LEPLVEPSIQDVENFFGTMSFFWFFKSDETKKVSKEWLFVCDPHGKVFESFQSKTSTVAEPQVAVASMDGTIYDAKITPVSPVHCVANNKKQKALYRASPKLGPLAGPPPVYIADAGGEIQIPERWDFFIPEVGLSC